jgi:GAF domain-containing protein/HAMP domain-containing protein
MKLRSLVSRAVNRLARNSLRTKLQAIIIVLMMAALLATTAAFIVGTRLTQQRLLGSQTEAESERVVTAIQSRAQDLTAAARLLAEDPQIAEALQQDSEEALQTLNGRAVRVRDRFSIGLIQIYDADGTAKANLLLSSLYRESDLLDETEPDHLIVRLIEERAILLSRSRLPGGSGDVVTGIDLSSELDRLAQQYRLTSELGLIIRDPKSEAIVAQVTTLEDETFPFDQNQPHGRANFVRRHTTQLGLNPAELILARSTTEIRQLMTTGLTVMILSSTLTGALLLALSIPLMRAIARPIHQLSETANAIADGDLSRRGEAIAPGSFLRVGHNDEIGLLTNSFNRMVEQLQDLYNTLESRVDARTRELATAAEVARSVSSSLDLDVILEAVSERIQNRLMCDYVAVYTIDDEASVAVLNKAVGEKKPFKPGYEVTLNANTPVARAARIHTSCLIADTSQEQRYLPTSWLPSSRSVAAIPILAGSDVIGVLELQSREVDKFSSEVHKLLNTLADQIGTGIQNARRYTEEQKRRRFTEVLELTGRILSGSLDLQELPGRALSSLRALVDYERGSLWMEEGSRLKPLAQYGYVDERPLHRTSLMTECSVYAKICHARQPLLIDDVQEQSEWETYPWLDGDRAWMGVPIITAHGKVIGMVSLTSTEIGVFDDEDAVWVQAFASQAGIALENASLYTEIAAISGESSMPYTERADVQGGSYKI